MSEGRNPLYDIIPLLPAGTRPMIMLMPEEYFNLKAKTRPSQWPALYLGLKGAQMFADFVRSAIQDSQIAVMQANIDLMIGTGIGPAYVQAEAGPEGDADHLRTQIKDIYYHIYDFWRYGTMQGVGSAYSSALEEFVASGQLIYAYKTLMYHTAITPRMERHWNRIFHPMVPDARMGWILYKRGKITWDQFKLYCAWDGWDAQGAEQLRETWTNIPSEVQALGLFWRGLISYETFDSYLTKQGWPPKWGDTLLKLTTRIPTPQEAYYMQNRGLLSVTQRNDIYKSWGWSAAWYDKITANFSYAPTVYDLMRLADYVELDQIWTLDKLARRGVEPKDAAKIWEALQLRPLADERKAITAKWTWRRRMGRATEDKLEDEFIELGIRAKEREMLIEKANLDYEDELIDEWVQILIWRFRTAVITEESFLNGLVTLGINEEKANLIVELEKAMGYFGYY